MSMAKGKCAAEVLEGQEFQEFCERAAEVVCERALESGAAAEAFDVEDVIDKEIDRLAFEVPYEEALRSLA